MPVRHPRLRYALATLAVATTGLLAVPAAPAAAAEATTLSVGPFRVTRNYGATQTFTFALAAGAKPVAGKTITIYTRRSTTVAWTKRTTRTTNSEGHTAASITLTRSTYVMARFAGSATYAADSSSAAFASVIVPFGTRVINEAATHRGAPYLWGAAGPTRFDCSGFTLYVFSRFGKSLPHNSGQQYASVRHVAKSDRRVGDLIFTYDSGGIYHVAIYAGNNEIWHAPHSGDVVKRSPIWTSSYYVGRVA